MKYYLIAGEASGDLHGSNLMKGLKKADPEAEFRFLGGDRMAEVGGAENLVKHYKETSFMGFVEVARNLKTILGQIRECKKDVEQYAPDVLILIDYAGFNLRMAKFAKSIGIRTFFYIAPKVWAWKESRVKKIKKYVDQLFVIFPFEIEYFRKHGIEAIYEGNPIMDSITERISVVPDNERFLTENGLDKRPVIALLAGSRKSEINNNLPFMVELSHEYPQYQFVIAGVSWLDKGIYDKYTKGSDVRYVCDKTYELLSISDGAVVTSGTATLETGLLGVPEVVCYRANLATMLIANAFIKVPYVSLVNINLGRESVRELLQFQMNMRNATAELNAILPGGSQHERMMNDFTELRSLIGGAGASDRFARRMVDLLKN